MHHALNRSRRVALLVAALAAGALPAAMPASAAPAAAQPPPSTGTSVTLLTGDRVRVAGKQLTVEPAAGRQKMHFLRRTVLGDSYVLPLDAAPLVADGRLDRRLFNITKLVEHRYDDRSRPALPLLITGSAGQSLKGSTTSRNLRSLGASAVRADRKRAGALWASIRSGRGLAPGITRVSLDGPVSATLIDSVPQIGAPTAWQLGHTGRGTKVAVLDTGLDPAHPDLVDAVTEAVDFTGSASGTDDLVGHGTHVAGIVTGSGAKNANFKGVAPDTQLLVGKVLGDEGGGTESQIIAGMEWAVSKGAKVVNLSLGSDIPVDGTDDPLSAAVNRLTAQSGALFVVSAGNNGIGGAHTIGSPAAAEAALTVGAVDKQNQLAYFSSRGPRLRDEGVKPEITAPGVDIGSAWAHPWDPESPYVSKSGTSMSAPHVAGAAAILAGQHPDWRAERIKAVLTGTAAPTDGPTVFQQGAGRVDVAKAVTQPVHAGRATINHGIVAWPHTDDVPIVTPVVYHNTGTAPVTLNLTVQVDGPNGPAPAGMFTVNTSTLTVPAGSNATANLTTDTRRTGPTGIYSGLLLATGASGITVRTPLSVHPEEERYDVTSKVQDRTGATASQYALVYTDLDKATDTWVYNPSGTVVARLPKGRYLVQGVVATAPSDPNAPYNDVSVRGEPNFVVDRDLRLDLDARQSRPVSLQVERTDAKQGIAALLFRSQEGPSFFVLPPSGAFESTFIWPSTTTAPGRFTFSAEGVFAKPSEVPGRFTNSPYLYNVRAVVDGRVPAGLSRKFLDRDLAVVYSTHAQLPGEDKFAQRNTLVDGQLPFRLTEYYSPDQDWDQFFTQSDPYMQDASLSRYGQRYRKGERYVEHWNQAPFGPGMPAFAGQWTNADRTNQQITAAVPMFVDQHLDGTGYADTASANTQLWRGSELIGENAQPGMGFFTVPPEPADYRLHAEVTRSNSPLSTSVSADWEFRSAAPPAGTTTQPLRLLAVRYLPSLDDHNQAPAGKPFQFGVAVQQNAGGLVQQGVSLQIQVSYNDGQTWQPATVTQSGDRWIASVTHPAGAGFASLRATAKDGKGNSVEQTIIRAYGLK